MKIAPLILAALLAAPAQAATVAEIGNARLTDEAGQCPRLHRVAYRTDFTRGCWTIGEHSREISITWEDGRVDHYTEMQFEIHGRVVTAGAAR